MFKEKIYKYCFMLDGNKEIIYPKMIDNQNFGYIIFCNTPYYKLTKKQLSAVIKALSKNNQISSIFEIDIEIFNKEDWLRLDDTIENYSCEDDKALERAEISKIRKIDTVNIEKYNSQMQLFENIIIDSENEWGISIFMDEWAIMFAKNDVLQDISCNYNLKNDIKNFKELIHYSEKTFSTNIDFLSKLITNVFESR